MQQVLESEPVQSSAAEHAPAADFALSARKRNPLIAPRGGAQCACVNIHPAGKLHHGGERPCAGSQRQETQADIRWELTGEPCRCLVNMRVMCAGACAWSRRWWWWSRSGVEGGREGEQRCGPTSSNHGVCCLQRPMTVHLTRAATSPGWDAAAAGLWVKPGVPVSQLGSVRVVLRRWAAPTCLSSGLAHSQSRSAFLLFANGRCLTAS